MIKFIKFIVLSVALFISCFSVNAQINNDTYLNGGMNALRIAVPFLTIAPDSRSASMGDAGAATAPDANSQHWNLSKYPFLKKDWGVSYSYTPWLRKLINDINLHYLTVFKKLDKDQVVSGSLLYFSMGEIVFTNDQGIETSKHNPNELALDIGYSRKFADLISGGLAFRYIRSDLTGGYSQQAQPQSNAGNSFAADISLYYEQPLKIENKNAQAAFGLVVSNIGTKISYVSSSAVKDFIPTNLRLGGRFSVDFDQYNSFSFVADANKFLIPTPPIYDSNTNEIIAGKDPNVSVLQGMLQSFNDAPGGTKEELKEISYAFGLEYIYSKQFAIRGGYFTEDKTKGNRKYYTLGAGLKYNIFTLDFAYLLPQAGGNNPMANTVRFTLSFDFDRNVVTTKGKRN